jgi:hypothetical protein
MPTARELLEQAEALMRRNRAIAMIEPGAVALPDEPAPAARGRGGPGVAADGPPAPPEVDDIPLLTDAVTDFDTAVPRHEPADGGEPSIWSDVDDEDRSIIGTEPDFLSPLPLAGDASAEISLGAQPPSAPMSGSPAAGPEAKEAAQPPDTSPALDPIAPAGHDVPASAAFGLPARIFDDPPTRAFEDAPAAPEPAAPAALPVGAAPRVAPPAADAERWNALAEEIRMQVLQRIDIFTDTGLKEQLARQLQPIVDRASADLGAAINQHVGQLLREYVAEAIEREIEKWRSEENAS